MEKVRIGFVGAGAMGRMAHPRNCATPEECEVAAAASRGPGRLDEKRGARLPGPAQADG